MRGRILTQRWAQRKPAAPGTAGVPPATHPCGRDARGPRPIHSLALAATAKLSSHFDRDFLSGPRRFVDRIDDHVVTTPHFAGHARLAIFPDALREIIHLQRLLVHIRAEVEWPLVRFNDRTAI